MKQEVTKIRGRVAAGSIGSKGLCIEAFADVDHKTLLGEAAVGENGRFEIAVAEGSRVWFGWRPEVGRSPRLQPFDLRYPVRLNVYSACRIGATTGDSFARMTVASTSRSPVLAHVGLLEVTAKQCKLLGEGFTEPDGAATIRYDSSALFRPVPDLRFVVFGSDGFPLLESRSPNIVIPGAQARTTSLFSVVDNLVREEGLLVTAEAPLDEGDFSYLVAERGLRPDSLANYAAARVLAAQAGVAAEVLFGLGEGSGDVEKALTRAVEEDRVAKDVLDRTKDVGPEIKRRMTALVAKKNLGHGSLDEFLALAESDETKRAAIANHLLETRNLKSLCEVLAKEKLATPPVQFLLELQTIAGVDVPLFCNLRPRLDAGTVKSGEDLALLSKAEWHELVVGQPPAEEGATKAPSINARAEALYARAQKVYPNKAFRREVERHRGSDWADKLAAHLKANPDLDFSKRPDESQSGTPLAAYKRVHDLSGDHAVTGAALRNGLASAIAIASTSKEEFVAKLAPHGAAPTAVAKTHAMAITKTAALNAASSFLPVGRRPTLCDCHHCKSIFGPAAYLFELLALFRRYSSGERYGDISLLDHLVARRPDITRIELSCPNTTTEIPQIDLVNEILEDRIRKPLGTSVVDNLADGECLPPHRQSQGTSEERRATPQNEPADEVVALLGEASQPWTLPYDYRAELARSARLQLTSRPEDVAFLAWRAATSSDEASATSGFAKAMLGISENKRALVVSLSATEDAWGEPVANDVGEAGPDLPRLARIAMLELAALEESLDTAFVRGDDGGELSIQPEDFCESGKLPRLVAPAPVLGRVLDRLHRFERIRRCLEWSPIVLDSAIEWIGGLDARTLDSLGLLRFFEKRLRLKPNEVLALFADPSHEIAPTLRQRELRTPFDTTFGADALTFEVPDPSLDADERLTSLIGQLSRDSGESIATIELAFEAGMVAAVSKLEDILGLPAADGQAAYRRAVAASYRLSLWSRRLRIDAEDFVALVAISGSGLLRRSGTAAEQLTEALRVVGLVDEHKDWGLEATELEALVGASGRLPDALTPSEVGSTLADLRASLVDAHAGLKPLPSAARPALRVALRSLLESVAAIEELDALVDAVASDLEWSAFAAARATAPDQYLSHHIADWAGLDPTRAPDPVAMTAMMDAALIELGETTVDQAQQMLPPGTAEPAAELAAFVLSVGNAVRQRVADPSDVDLAAVEAALSSFLSAAGAASPTPGRAQRFVESAWTALSVRLSSELSARALSIVSQIDQTRRLTAGRLAVTEWAVDRFGLSAAQATTLFAELSNPAGGAADILSAFLGLDGEASEGLRTSVVRSQLFAVVAGVRSAKPLGSSEARTLLFDWSQPVAVDVAVDVPRELLVNADGSAATLVVETDGAIEIEVVEAGASRSLISDVASDQVRAVRAAVGLITADFVTLRFTYTASSSANAHTLRVLRRWPDGTESEFPWATLTTAVGKLARAARVLKAAELPAQAWPILKTLPPSRALGLDALASGMSFETWQRLMATKELVARGRSEDTASVVVAFLTGREIRLASLVAALRLEATSLTAVLERLGITGSDATQLPDSVTSSRLRRLVELADVAARLHLPTASVFDWNTAEAKAAHDDALTALRIDRDRADWLGALAAVFDPVRENLRDAQVDFLIGPDRELVAEVRPIQSRADVGDLFLTDVEMSACMVTSRIQFAYSAIQRYVDSGQGSRVPWLPRGASEEAFAREWVSLRQYRLHEAQMRVLVHAENWIEPAIRPTKTPEFERLEDTLNSGPLDLQLAEKALREYAADLTDIAHLEPIAIVTHETEERDRPLAFRDSEIYGTHVFARTRANPRRLYYRRRLPEPDGRWTPWERLDSDLEGSHYVAVVVFGRLRLLCADFAVAREPRATKCSKTNGTTKGVAAGQPAITDYEVSLSWIDREHGRWSPVRRSDRFSFGVVLNGPDANEIFAEALPSVVDSINRDTASLSKIRVEIAVGEGDWRIKAGSSLRVRLGVEGRLHDFPLLEGALETIRETEILATELPAELPATSLDTIRLEWTGNEEILNFTDDLEIKSIRVVFLYESGERSWHIPRKIYRGLRWQPDAPDDPVSKGFPFKLLGGKSGDFGDEGEWRLYGARFEPVKHDEIPPVADYFEIESEVVPQSIDLSSALSLRADTRTADSLGIRIYSVNSSEEGLFRSRFRTTAETLRNIAEAREAWGDDWVSGGEFCHTYRVQQARLENLRVYPDDTVRTERFPFSSLGSHLGTSTKAQSLTSFDGEDFDTKKERGDTTPSVYGDNENLIYPASGYVMTVPRDRRISSRQSPKIVDENYGEADAPARTFLVERQLGLAPPTGDPLLYIYPHEVEAVAMAPSRELSVYMPPEIEYVPVSASGITNATGHVTVAAMDVSTNHSVSAALTVDPDADRRRESAVDIADILRGENWVDRTINGGGSQGVWRFATFWHPQAVVFRRLLEARGIERLTRFANQALTAESDLPKTRYRVDGFEARYHPTRFVDPRFPKDDVDFSVDGPYSEYNWELFFDSLLYMAERLDEDDRFDDADEIFGLLVDRGRVGQLGAWDDPTLYQTAPIRFAMELEPSWAASDVAKDEVLRQIERIRRNPYQPHLIARGWPTVYARALRIRFVEHLIRAGEADFRRAYSSDNRTFLESASARFELAARCLGAADDSLPESQRDEIPCYASLTSGASGSSGIEELEPYLPAELLVPADGVEGSGVARLHFCVPKNERLNELRVRVADLLLKLRSCHDIEGIRRDLSLYGRRIDPALLVRATAAGLDLDVVLGRVSGAKPSMYFQALWQRALQACERARSFEESWLGAVERAESEELSRLQNEQEVRSLEGQRDVLAERLQEARLLKEALERTVESAELRHAFYSTRATLSAKEAAEGRQLVEAGKADLRAASDSRAASDWAWVPTVAIHADIGGATPDGFYAKAGVSLRYPLGGETGVKVYRANAEAHRNDGARARVEAAQLGREANFERRGEDWKLQEQLALKDVQRGDRDLAGAEIRIEIAQMELELQRNRIEDTKTIRTFLRDKFTSKELHEWRANRMQRIRYQQHRIAYDLVAESRRALTREHGLDESTIVADPWDSSKKGVSAALDLIHELEKQQQLYRETWRREQEKLKVYSLVQRDPLAFLELLQTGSTIISITETDYDEDSAGDYFRRLRRVSLDIPAVRGPFSNVNGRLTQLSGATRLRAQRSSDPTYERDGNDDARFRDDLASGESIVTNTGVQDDGRLEPTQDGENPPAFAMNGAISGFRIELDPEQNHFDRNTVGDVILRLGITSRPGGESAMEAALAARRDRREDRPHPVMLPLHSAFSNEWHRFIEAIKVGDTGTLSLTFRGSHIPAWLSPANTIVQSELYFAIPEGKSLGLVEDDGTVDTAAFTMPSTLQPTEHSNQDPLHRMRLDRPMDLETEAFFRFRGDPVSLRRGWLICWVRS